MSDLIVMTFDDSEELSQLRDMVRQLQETSAQTLDATMIKKDREGKFSVYPLKEGEGEAMATKNSPNATTQADRHPAKSVAQIAPDREIVQEVLDSLPLEGAALLVLVDDGNASAALLTMLMPFAPRVTPLFVGEGTKSNEHSDAHFHADLESYQAAVANLEALRADSTEGDVEVVFKAVDDAYDRLARFIYAEQATGHA